MSRRRWPRRGQHQQAETMAAQAEAVARSMPEATRLQADALAKVAGALTRAGQSQQAEAIAEQAEATAIQADAASRIAARGAFGRRDVLGVVTGTLAQARQYRRGRAHGQGARRPRSAGEDLWPRSAGALAEGGAVLSGVAEAVARSITDGTRQAEALARVTGALARAGEHRKAEDLAESITDPDRQVRALVDIAAELARAGQPRQAEAVTVRAEGLVRSIPRPFSQVKNLAKVAGALARAGQLRGADAIAAQAETIIGSINDWDWQQGGPDSPVDALARAGQHQRAERLARSITDPRRQAKRTGRGCAVNGTGWALLAGREPRPLNRRPQ